MKKTNLDKILNEALNKALIGRNKIKQVNSNEIADFVNKHLEAINYTHSCTELICDNCDGAGGKNFTKGFLQCPKCKGSGKN